jgi:UDP-3-O-[3-hydroxymyristoyl] glucosamine N-acyltransferase
VTATIQQLVDLVHGKLLGDGALVIQAARPLQDAQAGDITFLEEVKNLERLQQSQAGAAIVPPGVTIAGKTLIHVADPLMAFVAVYRHLQGKTAFQPTGIDPRAEVHPDAQIGPDASIEAFASVGQGTVIGPRCRLHPGVIVGRNCKLGADVVLHPNVVLYDDIVLGDRVIIHANSTIGADGFGYRAQQGRNVKVPQLSTVIIGADVEIGASTCIDRGVFEPTRIGEGTKIDNLVHIAHNCQIGKHNLFAAQVGVAGSCTTGNYVVMGGQAGIRDHVRLGDGAQVGAKTGISEDVAPGKRMFWIPALEDRDAARVLACIRKLPAMRKDLLRLLKAMGLAETVEPVRNPEAPAA